MARRTVLVDDLVEGGSMENMSRDSVYRTGDLEPRRARHPPYWLLASILMVGLHALWSVWLTAPDPRAMDVVSAGPRVRYLVGGPTSSPRIFDPTVFALPAEVGFSGHALSNRFDVAPAIRIPGGAVRFLEREPRTSRDLMAWGDASPPVPRPPVPQMVPEPSVSRPPGGQGTVTGLQVSVRDDPDEMGFLTEVPLDGATWTRAWKMSVRADVDEAGQVVHALVDSSSGDVEVDRAVIRLVKGWSRKPGSESTSGIVDLSYVPIGVDDELVTP